MPSVVPRCCPDQRPRRSRRRVQGSAVSPQVSFESTFRSTQKLERVLACLQNAKSVAGACILHLEQSLTGHRMLQRGPAGAHSVVVASTAATNTALRCDPVGTVPTDAPTASPTPKPRPTVGPTATPTYLQTARPTTSPTFAPTASPTKPHGVCLAVKHC